MKKYRIPFRRDMLNALKKGKRVTRRMNENWLKVKEGDVLLAHEGRYGKTEAQLVATRDAYKQPLSRMTDRQCEEEGVEWIGNDIPGGPEWFDVGTKQRVSTAKEAFTALWDSINGHKPGAASKDDPSPVVIEFKLLATLTVGEEK
jgi:hypothetical protein